MKKIGVYIATLLMVCSTTLTFAVSAEEPAETDPEVWIDGWKLRASEDLQLYSSHILRFWDGSYGYDESGNFYVAFVDENVQIQPANPGDATHASDQRGIYILKYDSSGVLQWTKNITSTRNDCNNVNHNSCRLMGLHVVGEDTFYMTWQTYHSTTFELGNGVEVDVNGHRLAVAYHNLNGWQYADSVQTRGWTVDYVIKQEVDADNNLILVFKENNNGGLQEYTVRAFDDNGGKWARNLEVSHEWPTYDYNPVLVDVDGTQTHFFAFTKGSIRYDSQTISCPSDSIDDHCHIWFSIDSNGIKQADVVVNYTSMKFTESLVNSGSMYLLGTTYGELDDLYTQSNFSGTVVEHNARTGYMAKLSGQGVWELAEPITSSSGNEIPDFFDHRDEGFAGLFAHDNGDITFHFQSFDGGFYDGQYFSMPGQFTVSTYQTFVTINAQGAYKSHTSVGYENTDSYNNDYAAKPVVGPNGYLAAFFEGRGGEGDVILPDGTSHYGGLAFIDYEDGGVLDFKPIESWGNHNTYPLAVSPNGDLMAWEEVRINNVWYESFTNFAVDRDSDGIGEGDNCPSAYNPEQTDYDGDGEGDACDDDDDGDTIPDDADSCPTSDLDWESNPDTNHDLDGCEDNTEDYDDDADGVADTLDMCPRGVLGYGSDADEDGCKDIEDLDDDNDGVNDGSDSCNPGALSWPSGTLTDHDGDGCRDTDEDYDDDNDGVLDALDSCPRGMTNWISNSNTDADADGCHDATEDLDCCTNTDENTTSGPEGVEFYYLCPVSLDVVDDIDECPESKQIANETNVTNIIIDPGSNLSDEYQICPDGNYIVLNGFDCPTANSTGTQDQVSVVVEESLAPWVLYVAMASVGVSVCSMLIVIFRSGKSKKTEDAKWNTESIDQMFGTASSPSKNIEEWVTGKQSPPIGMSGAVDDGYEWIEWPPKSNDFWYRDADTNDEWQRYDNKSDS